MSSSISSLLSFRRNRIPQTTPKENGQTRNLIQIAGLLLFFTRSRLRRSRRMQRSQNLREKIVAVFSRYLEQAHVRVAPNDGSKRCISLFLHDPENRDHPVQKRPDARGIRIRMALHAANFVHQNQITVLRIRQRGQSRRLKHIRKRRDAERRAADADAVMRIAEQILCCGRMQINRPAAIRLRLCRDSAESPKPLRFDGIQCSSSVSRSSCNTWRG